jgi:putative MATE family efflux protein
MLRDRRSQLLEGPVAATLLSLGAPVLAVLALQTFVGIAETYFVSSLGTDAVAGVVLVFPLLMLMTMMSNGGIGGGVASAVARALGAGRQREAEALATHALAIAVALGAVFSVGVWTGGRALFAVMGGRNAALGNAVAYATIAFSAAVPAWIASLLGAALRGAGNVRTPALVTAGAAFTALGLSPSLIFGLGPFPALGVTGAALAVAGLNVASAAALLLYMLSPRAALRLRRTRLEARLLKNILSVGLVSAAGTVMSNLCVVLATGYAGRFGAAALAGYGLASRLDYVLIPLLFALGTASVTLVGTAIGAGDVARARRVAGTAASMSVLAVGAIGAAAALFPGAWIGLFSADHAVIAAGTAYLVRVGPAYALFGAGMALYFAGQGAGRMAWPFAAGLARLLVVGGGGWLWTARGGGIGGLFLIVAASYAAFGALNLLAFLRGYGWTRYHAQEAIIAPASR